MKKKLCCTLLFFLCALVKPSEANNSTKLYEYQIAACLMFQNETFFLKEWIEYHKLIGIEHFYLFNNGSTDNYLDILRPYILKGEVELYDYPEVGMNQGEHNRIQCDLIYTHALSLARHKAKWLAIIDADEFIVPLQTNSLRKVLRKYENCGGLYLNYLVFGTSHVEKVPKNRLIIETLNLCAEAPINFGKSIVRPERVSHCTDPHRMWYLPPYVHVNSNFQTFDWTPPSIADDKILIFHFGMGDIHHAKTVKIPRRAKWIGIKEEEYMQSQEYLNARVNNEMQRFLPQLRKKMGLSKSKIPE
jgi:Glycosyltransferase family 92